MRFTSKLLRTAGPIRLPMDQLDRICKALIRTYQREAQDPEYLMKGTEVHNTFGVQSPWVNGEGDVILDRNSHIDIKTTFVSDKAPASGHPRAFILGAGARFWGDDVRVDLRMSGPVLLRWDTHWIKDHEFNESTTTLQFVDELKSILTHEFAHLMDPALSKKRRQKTWNKVDQKQYYNGDTYHNNVPIEVRAYLAQCAQEMRNYMQEYYWEGDTFQETVQRGVPHWTRQLANTLTPENRRIILKELGKIWTEFQGKGKK